MGSVVCGELGAPGWWRRLHVSPVEAEEAARHEKKTCYLPFPAVSPYHLPLSQIIHKGAARLCKVRRVKVSERFQLTL